MCLCRPRDSSGPSLVGPTAVARRYFAVGTACLDPVWKVKSQASRAPLAVNGIAHGRRWSEFGWARSASQAVSTACLDPLMKVKSQASQAPLAVNGIARGRR